MPRTPRPGFRNPNHFFHFCPLRTFPPIPASAPFGVKWSSGASSAASEVLHGIRSVRRSSQKD